MLRGLFISFFLLCGAMVAAASPLAVELKVFAVTALPEGKEQLAEVETVRPGQLLEYRAVFTNVSDKALSGVVPEVPIPAGMTVIPESIEPQPYTVSSGDGHFAALPLPGAEAQAVDAANIRAVRWPATSLKAKDAITVRLRAKVNE